MKNTNTENIRRLKNMTKEKEQLILTTRKKLVFNHDNVGHIMEEPSSKVTLNHIDGSGTSDG